MGIHSNSTCYKFSSNVIHEMEVIWLTIISTSLKLSEGKLNIFQAKALKRRSYPTFLSYTDYTWNKMKYTWCKWLVNCSSLSRRINFNHQITAKRTKSEYIGWEGAAIPVDGLEIARSPARTPIQSCLCFCETWEECENWDASNTIASFCFYSAEKSHSMISSEQHVVCRWHPNKKIWNRENRNTPKEIVVFEFFFSRLA